MRQLDHAARSPESSATTSVLSIVTPLLGHRTYGELLRAAFDGRLAFDLHWSDEEEAAHGDGALERQIRRWSHKMIEAPFVRRRNLDFFPLRYELGTSYWARRTLGRILRTQRPDVLHLHSQAISFLSLDVMRRIPTVISADGTSYQMAEQQLDPSYRWTFAANHALERLAFSRAAAVVAFSAWAARSIVERHRIDARKVRVIPAGVELGRFADVARARAALADGTTRILFIGGEFERKGGPLLVRTFLERFGDDPTVELHLVTRAATIPSHPRIVRHERVEAFSPEWSRLYAAADVFAMPTRRDQSPNVFLEAMAAELPIVTTHVGAAAEIVADGRTGFVVGRDDEALFAERLTALVRDADLRRTFGARARRRVVDGYDVKRTSAELAAVFSAAARARPV
jgi:glycosyltransferase involved in cell wall biosynthesis